MSAKGRRHLEKVAQLGMEQGCIVCGQPFAHVHHVMEGRTPGRRSGDFCTIPLCYECHEGAHGIHGTRQRWTMYKASELEALNRTLEALA